MPLIIDFQVDTAVPVRNKFVQQPVKIETVYVEASLVVKVVTTSASTCTVTLDDGTVLRSTQSASTLASKLTSYVAQVTLQTVTPIGKNVNRTTSTVAYLSGERVRKIAAINANTSSVTLTTGETFRCVGSATTLQATFNAIPGPGGGAPTDAEYVVLSANGSLSDERVLTAGTGVSIVDGGAGSSVTISSSGGDPDAAYVVLSATGSLSTERVLTAGTGISIVDGGAGSTVTISSTGGGGGSQSVSAFHGNLLWAWNQTDTSQFASTATTYQANGGTNPINADTRLSLSVFNYGEPFGNVLRVTATNFSGAGLNGGGHFPILGSELTLPERYVVYIRRGFHQPNFPNGARGYFMLAYTGGGASFNGLAIDRVIGTSGCDIYPIVGGEVNTSFRSYTSSGTWQNPADLETGGIEQWIGISRPDATTPSYARAFVADRGGSAHTMPFQTELLHTVAGVSTNWDGLDFTGNPGPGMLGALNNTTGVVDYAQIRIYEYLDDIT